MTTEQEKAIEILERIDVKFFISGMNEASNYIIDEADKVNNAIEIALNMLKEKDAEIEKKDKQIDLMADFIGQDMRCIRPEIECNKMTHDCKDCVKQYFADLVEKE